MTDYVQGKQCPSNLKSHTKKNRGCVVEVLWQKEDSWKKIELILL